MEFFAHRTMCYKQVNDWFNLFKDSLKTIENSPKIGHKHNEKVTYEN